MSTYYGIISKQIHLISTREICLSVRNSLYRRGKIFAVYTHDRMIKYMLHTKTGFIEKL